MQNSNNLPKKPFVAINFSKTILQGDLDDILLKYIKQNLSQTPCNLDIAEKAIKLIKEREKDIEDNYKRNPRFNPLNFYSEEVEALDSAIACGEKDYLYSALAASGEDGNFMYLKGLKNTIKACNQRGAAFIVVTDSYFPGCVNTLVKDNLGQDINVHFFKRKFNYRKMASGILIDVGVKKEFILDIRKKYLIDRPLPYQGVIVVGHSRIVLNRYAQYGATTINSCGNIDHHYTTILNRYVRYGATTINSCGNIDHHYTTRISEKVDALKKSNNFLQFDQMIQKPGQNVSVYDFAAKIPRLDIVQKNAAQDYVGNGYFGQLLHADTSLINNQPCSSSFANNSVCNAINNGIFIDLTKSPDLHKVDSDTCTKTNVTHQNTLDSKFKLPANPDRKYVFTKGYSAFCPVGNDKTDVRNRRKRKNTFSISALLGLDHETLVNDQPASKLTSASTEANIGDTRNL